MNFPTIAGSRRFSRICSTVGNSARGIERLWEVSESVLRDPPPLEPYEPGSWGPQAANALIAPRRWHLPSDHV